MVRFGRFAAADGLLRMVFSGRFAACVQRPPAGATPVAAAGVTGSCVGVGVSDGARGAQQRDAVASSTGMAPPAAWQNDYAMNAAKGATSAGAGAVTVDIHCDAPVTDLHEIVQRRTGIPARKQRLAHAGRARAGSW